MTPRQKAEWILDNWDDRVDLIDAIATAIQAASNEQLERCRAHDRQADVSAFHRKFGVPMPGKPGWPAQDRIDLRVKLIAEEFCEFLDDCGYEFTLVICRFIGERVPGSEMFEEIFERYNGSNEPDCANFPKAADALIDLEYVILGTHVSMGIDSNPLWAEVQAANMRKTGGATRADGKILKPENWVGPDIEARLREQGWTK